MSVSASGFFRSLRSYNYRVWSAGALVSNVGTWMQRTAQDWLVLTGLTHHSAAAVGIVINGATALLFARGRKHDINIRGAFLHMAADALVSLGVVAAGAVILLTGLDWLDPVTSLAIVAVIGWGTWGLLRDSVKMGLLGVPLPWVEIGIAVSSIVLGLFILTDVRISLAIAIPLVTIFALFHGHAHGTELSPGADAVLYSAGFVISTGLLHTLGIGVGAIEKLPRGRTAVRALGGGILLGGSYFLLGALA